jgi:hypothetical protein
MYLWAQSPSERPATLRPATHCPAKLNHISESILSRLILKSACDCFLASLLRLLCLSSTSELHFGTQLHTDPRGAGFGIPLCAHLGRLSCPMHQGTAGMRVTPPLGAWKRTRKGAVDCDCGLFIATVGCLLRLRAVDCDCGLLIATEVTKWEYCWTQDYGIEFKSEFPNKVLAPVLPSSSLLNGVSSVGDSGATHQSLACTPTFCWFLWGTQACCHRLDKRCSRGLQTRLTRL